MVDVDQSEIDSPLDKNPLKRVDNCNEKAQRHSMNGMLKHLDRGVHNLVQICPLTCLDTRALCVTGAELNLVKFYGNG